MLCFWQPRKAFYSKSQPPWFGEAWVAKTYGDQHEEVLFFGVIEKFHAHIQKFMCQFEGDSRGYPATWDDLSDYIVHSSMCYNSPKKSVVIDAHDALNWDGQGTLPHVDNKGSPTLDEAIPPARGQGNIGRPKGPSMHTSTNPSLEFTRNIGRPRKHRLKSHASGRLGTSASPYEEASDDDDDNDYALEREGIECGYDDGLEADRPVLDDSHEADCGFVDIVPLEGRSGDKMEQEPPRTFWPLPTFNGLVGQDLGHVPHEFFVHLFLMLLLLDLIDHIINETNRYANLQRGKCSSLHESMRIWVPLDCHSFLRFLGMALGMALNYMPSKQHYWKDDMIGSFKLPKFGDKMSGTSFQQIKRYLTSVKLLEHLRSEGQGGTGTYVCNRKYFPGKEMLNLGLKACGGGGALKRGQVMHAEISKRGLLEKDVIANATISMYSKWGRISKKDFTKLKTRDMNSCNVVSPADIQEGGKQCFWERTEATLRELQEAGHRPSFKAYSNVSDVDKGQEIHMELVEEGFDSGYLVGSALASGYAKCGFIVEAQGVFDELDTPKVISGNSMTGAIGKRKAHEGELHGLLKQDPILGNTWVDVWAKSGSFVRANDKIRAKGRVAIQIIPMFNSSGPETVTLELNGLLLSES
ncbi:hypothetical protein L7F22_033077 [Adiantum nelumboides]|nr:hypothetical protein [Adiantum nelumboides]